jgi:hypothetical protein
MGKKFIKKPKVMNVCYVKTVIFAAPEVPMEIQTIC